MRVLYIDCQNGLAGDMLTASLTDLMQDEGTFLDRLNHVGIPTVTFEKSSITRYGITGSHMTVKVGGVEEREAVFEAAEHHHHHEHEHGHEHHHHHSTLHSIGHIVEEFPIPQNVKDNVLGVYKIIAEAESKVHGEPVSEIHFHEVGNLDAIADITAVCMAIEELKPDKIIASPICTGFGEVKCAHGILPVPAPATAEIIKGLPVYAGETRGELCTPTGAALVKYFADEFAQMPLMTVDTIGNGMGTKDFGKAGALRTFIGNNEDATDTIVELSCNVDDMTPEEVGFAINAFLESGALEAFTVPIGMKKNRPGFIITVFCKEEKKQELVRLIFKHTSTIGIREDIKKRYVLNRNVEEKDTLYGKVKVKVSEGYGVKKTKYEYEDITSIARNYGKSIAEVKSELDDLIV